LAVGGVVVLLLAVVILLQTTHLMPGTSKADVASTTPPSVAVSTSALSPATGNASTPGASTDVTSPAVSPHVINDPARIVIPAIGVDAQMVHVGMPPGGPMELPPYGLAAWYKLGVAPGAPGPAVIIGHVDSQKKADVFHKLSDLKTGDLVLVYDSNGDFASFQADSSELVLKQDLPIARIWNKTTEPVLRLITCGGKWDASLGHYLSNLIVYCHLVK